MKKIQDFAGKFSECLLGNHIFFTGDGSLAVSVGTSKQEQVGGADTLVGYGAPVERFLPRRGWYMLEVLLHTRKDVSTSAIVRFECAGFIAPLEVVLSCRSGAVAKRIVWLPGALDRVSLKSGNDSIVCIKSAKLQVKRLLKGFATRRMLMRLSNRHPSYCDLSPQSILRALPGKRATLLFGNNVAHLLYRSYQESFSLESRGAPLVAGVLNQPDATLNKMLDYPKVELQPTSSVFRDKSLIIHWVTCDFAAKGGGGNMTIFRFVRLFELFGHQQHIWLHNKSSHHSTDSAYEDLVRNYQQTSALVRFISDEPDAFSRASGDIIIATDWQSVWPVLSVSGFKRRFYFVQDHEPSFFAVGSQSLAAGATYREDFDCICAGPWLEKLMQERYGRWATKFWLAADPGAYYPPDVWPENEVPRIAFYARSATSRRAVELGLLALDYLSRQSAMLFHVDLYGSSDSHLSLQSVKYSWTNHGVLDSDELGELYRSCDVGMVFSATNYSLVPQEMMACRLAVLEMEGDNTRTVFPDDSVLLTEPHPQYIAEKLLYLLQNPMERRRIAMNGQAWASQFSWAETASEVDAAIHLRLEGLGYEKLKPANQSAVKVSVVIPTLNGGELLLKVLNKVKEQKAPWLYDVLVIDSGSSDGTLGIMQSRTDIRLHVIPQAEFNHGGTRNLGVEMTGGEYVAFLTQDALPADEFWLFHLVSALEHDAEAAGAFGKHLPYPDASPFIKRDLHAHFENLAQYPLYLSKDTDRKRFNSGEQVWRQILHFYSDNNSCMRRSVWKKIPYPVIDYGEDQVWADQIIKSGYKKAYAINAVVYHSHDYDEVEALERAGVEARYFKEYFGYEL